MTTTQPAETFETAYRFLAIYEYERGIHFCDTCGKPALFIKSDAKGVAVKACNRHGKLGE